MVTALLEFCFAFVNSQQKKTYCNRKVGVHLSHVPCEHVHGMPTLPQSAVYQNGLQRILINWSGKS